MDAAMSAAKVTPNVGAAPIAPPDLEPTPILAEGVFAEGEAAPCMTESGRSSSEACVSASRGRVNGETCQ